MKSVKLIGFEQSTLTNEIKCILANSNVVADVVSPADFFAITDHSNNCYLNTVTRDRVLRNEISNYLDSRLLPLHTFIHPTAYVCSTATISAGVFIGPFAGVFMHAIINAHVILAPYTQCSHYSVINKNSELFPRAAIAGHSIIGENCLIGMNSTITDHVIVCDNVFIGANSAVSKNITTPGKYIGFPRARKCA